MKRTIFSMSGWAVAVAALVLSGASWVTSQPAPFPDGAFVAAQDGSRWVVGGGTRYRMSFTNDDTNALYERLPVGDQPVLSGVTQN